MTKVRVKLVKDSLYKIRSSPQVVAELERRGRQILDAANATMPDGDGYSMSSFQGARKPYGRWFVQVFARTNHAKRSNAKHNTLIRVLNDTQNPTPRAVDLAPGKHP